MGHCPAAANYLSRVQRFKWFGIFKDVVLKCISLVEGSLRQLGTRNLCHIVMIECLTFN